MENNRLIRQEMPWVTIIMFIDKNTIMFETSKAIGSMVTAY